MKNHFQTIFKFLQIFIVIYWLTKQKKSGGRIKWETYKLPEKLEYVSHFQVLLLYYDR